MKKKDISELTEEKIRECLEANLDTIDREKFKQIVIQAKIGMDFVKDREVMKRIQNGQEIRIINLITIDKEKKIELLKERGLLS